MTVGRFYPQLKANQNSRFASLADALRGHISSLINDPTAPAGPAGNGTPNPPANSASSAMTDQVSATKATQPPPLLRAPKPMPVPADVEARGPDFVRGYRDGFRRENRRCLALLAHPAARGKGISLSQLICQGLDDDAILARLPQAASDEEQRVMMRRAEVGAVWDRAIAKAFGQPAPATASSPSNSADQLWANAIAANNPGYKPPATPSSASETWDRVYAKMHRK